MDRTKRNRIVESLIAGIIGGVGGVVIQRLMFGTTKNLFIGVLVGVMIDVAWQSSRNAARKRKQARVVGDAGLDDSAPS